MNYELIIGLEVHVELGTKSKMFCRCSTDYFGKPPNSNTCPICLGLPGSLPTANKQAIEHCMKIGLALHCQVAELSRFERKNYFYPDLPKSYQISQYRWPLCTGGWLDVVDGNGVKSRIRINRVHQEEDTGKLTHTGGQTLIDYNRSGIPLVEIVTEPDFHDSAQVRDFAKKLQQIFRYLGVSNADMEKGDMRLEANVSVRPVGQTELPPYRIELKNINSFRFMVAAIEYEVKRQSEALERGEKLYQETRGWDEEKKETYLQRSKEEAHDYRYFPDPDLPELRVKDQELQIMDQLPELPEEKAKRYQDELNLSTNQAEILVSSLKTAEYFEKTIKLAEQKNITANQIANYLINRKPDISQIQPQDLVQQISGRSEEVIDNPQQIRDMVDEVIRENPQLVETYKKGKTSVIQSLVGQAMRKSGGKAKAQAILEILEERLKQ